VTSPRGGGGPPSPPARWIRLGVVGRPHGVRGAVHLHLDNPRSTALSPGTQVRLAHPSSPAVDGVPHVVRRASGGVLSLDGVDDRTAAEALTHAVVEIPRSALGDDVLLADLLGVDVVDTQGAVLGRIVAFHDNGAQPLAELARPAAPSVLVPFVPPLVVALGPPVVLAPPRGLFDDADALVVERDEAGDGDGGGSDEGGDDGERR
jgi:16S rRNA processing protein RimM